MKLSSLFFAAMLVCLEPLPVVDDVAGTWNITDAKLLGGNSYTGTVAIAKQGSVHNGLYNIDWKTSAGDYSGLGFHQDGELFIGWGTKDYGVVLYTIGNGTLDGQWTGTDMQNSIATEQASGGTAGKVEGTYKVSGKHLNGAYKGTLVITKTGEVYQLKSTIDGGKSVTGVGLRSGDKLAVGWGIGGGFGVVHYTFNGKTATGQWALPNESKLGTENLKR